jgi:hypothetical protein
MPNVSLDSKRIMYRDAPNPIIISNGEYKFVKVLAINGILKKGENPNQYYVTPGDEDIYTTLMVITDQDSFEYRFYLKPLPYPEAMVAGPRNEDSMIEFFRATTGVLALIRNFDFEVNFVVDSFTITFSDSVSIQTHRNIGNVWDQKTRDMLNEAKSKTVVTIQDVYISGPVEKYFLRQKIEYWIR